MNNASIFSAESYSIIPADGFLIFRCGDGTFGKIITSFVDDVITPLLLNPALEAANLKNISELTWNGVKYGNFLSAIISFLIIAMVLFMLIKAVNKVNKPAVEAPAGPSNEEVLLAEIRDLLKNK